MPHCFFKVACFVQYQTKNWSLMRNHTTQTMTPHIAEDVWSLSQWQNKGPQPPQSLIYRRPWVDICTAAQVLQNVTQISTRSPSITDRSYACFPELVVCKFYWNKSEECGLDFKKISRFKDLSKFSLAYLHTGRRITWLGCKSCWQYCYL